MGEPKSKEAVMQQSYGRTDRKRSPKSRAETLRRRQVRTAKYGD